ncbi:MAG TPA: hypothetical protein VF576_03825 [Rubricoccaceae bacterium]|jgi:hypothetical protein
MYHRPLVAALVLGLTTTGALCGDDAPDAPAPLAGSQTASPAPGAAAKPDAAPAAAASSDKSGGASGIGGAAQSVGSGGLREHSGALAAGDATLDSGEFADAYTIDVEAGQTILVDVMSTSELDPYIILRAPSGEQFENDDYEGDRTRSRVEQAAGEAGAWRVIATSYEPGQEGSYDITIRTGAGGSSPAGGK